MSIIDLAESDLAATLESTSDFGQVCSLVNPDELYIDLSGQFSSIGQFIDPDTGVEVAGNFVQFTARISSITNGQPRGIEDESSKPWIVINGAEKFKVFKTFPDKKLGILSMILEPFQ